MSMWLSNQSLSLVSSVVLGWRAVHVGVGRGDRSIHILVSFQAATQINAYGNPKPNHLCLI